MSKIDEAMVEAALAAYKGGFVQYADCAPEYSPKGAMREAIAAALQASEPQGVTIKPNAAKVEAVAKANHGPADTSLTGQPQGEARALADELEALRPIHTDQSDDYVTHMGKAIAAITNMNARHAFINKHFEAVLTALRLQGAGEREPVAWRKISECPPPEDEDFLVAERIFRSIWNMDFATIQDGQLVRAWDYNPYKAHEAKWTHWAPNPCDPDVTPTSADESSE